MLDREKVIEGLKLTEQFLIQYEFSGHIQQIHDAIELLKEQEPKMVKVIKNAYNEEFYCCPNCDKQFYGYIKRPLYCDQCGQVVKWE